MTSPTLPFWQVDKLPSLPPKFFWAIKVDHVIFPLLKVKLRRRRNFLGVKFSTTVESVDFWLADKHLADDNYFQILVVACARRALEKYVRVKNMPVQLGAAQELVNKMVERSS